MIQANELRIGNLIKWAKYSETGKVKTIYDVSVMLTTQSGYAPIMLSDLEPIALTDELLAKAGFVNNKMGFSKRVHLEDCKVALRIDIPSGLVRIYATEGDSTQQILWPQPILYLHQLQNLCFALTGEELNIEL